MSLSGVPVVGRVEVAVPPGGGTVAPVGVGPTPGTYEELEELYGADIVQLVRRYNRVESNQDDLVQHVWEQLLHRDVIGKYARYCGGFRAGAKIQPYWTGRAGRTGSTAVTLTDPMPFRKYLAATVRNIWANWCRTYARRFGREDPAGTMQDW